ncbi:MAG: hypothetical protein SFY92_11565 [Verrucomicrobiae bacterium]|nr:hypothetical protein [Verrucomicrobiae bacterium]
MRYFTDGAVLGSREFAEKVYQKHKHVFGIKRKDGPRPMQGAVQWGGLMTLRNLRQQAISPSQGGVTGGV